VNGEADFGRDNTLTVRFIAMDIPTRLDITDGCRDTLLRAASRTLRTAQLLMTMAASLCVRDAPTGAGSAGYLEYSRNKQN
jgi:hypothetical protein